jgi:putative Mg2+ transporter-C (MgtC) family protein
MTAAEMAVRLLLSALFGTLVGIERQWRHKSAGLKTNALVSVGATAFGLIALISFGPGSNPTQIAAGVVTGIGFIGAGVIMHRGASVQGINTAATLWAAAGMGLSIGQGSIALAALILASVLILQLSLPTASSFINRRSRQKGVPGTFRLYSRFSSDGAAEVQSALTSLCGEPGTSVTNIEQRREQLDSVIEVQLTIAETRTGTAVALNQRFAELPGVIKSRCEQITEHESD